MTVHGGRHRPNPLPGAYRGVALTNADCDLDEASLRAHFVGREAYRRTRFIVVRDQDRTALVAIEKKPGDDLFLPIVSLELLAGVDDCAYVEASEVDTAVPSALAAAARRRAPGKRAVVVQGRYGHVSFIVDPAPLRITVREITPPHPAKLLDQARRVLELAEDLPPIELVPDVVEFEGLARSRPSPAYLLPCRGGGVEVAGATVSYLDERPDRHTWTLIGCERSQQIHEWFYGERAPQVDICPWKRTGGTGAILAKCCLLETDIEVEDDLVVVPWGASLEQVSDALTRLAAHWEPTWAPA